MEYLKEIALDNSVLVVAVGSHIDSVYKGGNYDGVIDVVSDLKILLSLNDASI